MNKGNIFYNQCMMSTHMYQDVNFIYKVLWHAMMCLFILQTSLPHSLTAVVWHPHGTQPTATSACPQLHLQTHCVMLHSVTIIHQKAYP